jgi:glycosyltransferase involved in cell wall biosynthesis
VSRGCEGWGHSSYWVVIPAYNESAMIRGVVERALAHVPNVIVVDDGSTDDTGRALAGLPITLLRHEQNMGKAASLRTGCRYAINQGACGLITLDGDGQHAPEDIPTLLSTAFSYPDYLIIGARRREERRLTYKRYIANCVADFWISWAAGTPFEDTQSGFRIYPISLFKQLSLSCGKSRSFVFESEILIEAVRSGYRCVAVVIGVLPRAEARASYFLPVVDIARITIMVGGKILSKGLYLGGLYRSLRYRPLMHVTHMGVQKDRPRRPNTEDPKALPENHDTQTASG